MLAPKSVSLERLAVELPVGYRNVMMDNPETNQVELILASSSPRRSQLLTEAGYRFRVIEPPISEPETMGADVPAVQQAEALSYFKARSIAPLIESEAILAADTIVSCDGQVFGKPIDRRDAHRILAALAGKPQEVITGVTLLSAKSGRRMIAHDVTTVWMRQLSEETLDRYLDSGEWTGKAGAYGIQDRADAFVERIEGSFTNVVGLPMELVASMLQAWGMPGQQSPQHPSKT